MSEIKRRITLTRDIQVEETTVLRLEATISSDLDMEPNYSRYVTNSNLYYSNLEEVRNKEDEFKSTVRAEEDKLVNN